MELTALFNFDPLKPPLPTAGISEGCKGHAGPCSSGLCLSKTLGASFQRGSKDKGSVSVCFALL